MTKRKHERAAVDYRRAKGADFMEIAALDRVAWKHNNNPEFIPDGEHAWRIWAEYALTFVAHLDAELVGAVLAFPCLDSRYCLHKVIVCEQLRGQGIGSGLFRILFTELDRMSLDVFLTVDPANKGAVTLYQSWGFDSQEFVVGFYRPNEDRLVLTRQAKVC